MRCEVTDVTGTVKYMYIGKTVFRDQNVGEAPPPPPKFLFGGEGGRGLYSAAYEHEDCQQSVVFPLSHCRLRTRARGKWQSLFSTAPYCQ